MQQCLPGQGHRDGERMKTMEGSIAIAEVVSRCDPDLVACFPITPSTHIAEHLDKLYTDGKIREYVAVDSEFAAISTIVGGSAAGGRVFSTTASQGLALMHEVLFTAAGMRLPVVMVVANRTLSAPLGIWNDHSDTMAERDSGWYQLYAATNQEAVDSVVQMFKLSEATMIPGMVNIDGFYLTHLIEQIDIPSEQIIKQFLPPFKPPVKLDPDNPLALGVYTLPKDYPQFREDLHADLQKSQEKIKKIHDEWAKLTGRRYGNGLWEEYMVEDADVVMVMIGSLFGNAQEAVDALRREGVRAGALRLRFFRPFPDGVARRLEGKRVIVIEKVLSPGAHPPLYTELLAQAYEEGIQFNARSVVKGLGGQDVPVHLLMDLVKQ